MKRRFRIGVRGLLAALALSGLAGGCGRAEPTVATEIRLASGGQVKTLDPALADDAPSRNLAAAFYDTLLEYDYPARPYRLRPSMLAEMPQVSPDGRCWRLRLRSDLVFADDPCFADGQSRRVTSADVIYSWLRLADARLHSPVYWTIRGKFEGLDEFHRRSGELPPGDFSLYDRGIPGLRAISDTELEVRLTRPDDRFRYLLALPWLAVVSRRGAEYYSTALADHPVGSGPFVLNRFRRDYEVVMDRNPDYREQYFPEAEDPADRTRRLPLADRIVCRVVKQPMANWLLFLQGNFDLAALDKDNLDLAANARGELAPALAARGIRLLRMPEFEVRYVGFNLSDPVLRDLRVRRALALTYDLRRREEFYNFQMLPASGPIPPGVAGHLDTPPLRTELEEARHLLAEAGYPGGRDPETGEPLTLTFDQAGSSSQHRQLGELAAADWAALGIRVLPVLNSRPRFVEKLRQGSCQLFRYSWVGDYPDPENFLQLFYSRNRGINNYAGYADPEFDRGFEQLRQRPDSPERDQLAEQLAEQIVRDQPWICEGYPISYLLSHSWLRNYQPHDFAFNRWKYLAVDPARREELRRNFTPLNFEELR